MRLGDKILELRETRQLTFEEHGNIVKAMISPSGKFIACLVHAPSQSNSSRPALVLLRIPSGSTSVLLQAVEKDSNSKDIPEWAIDSYSIDETDIAWSLDSKYIAVTALHSVHGKDSVTQTKALVVLDTAGTTVFSFSVPDDWRTDGMYLTWSPDSAKLANVFRVGDSSGLALFDTADGSVKTAYTHNSSLVQIAYWHSDSKSIVVSARKGLEPADVVEVYLDGSPKKDVADFYKAPPILGVSPDGVYTIKYDFKVFSVVRCADGEEVRTIKTANPDDFRGWSPDCRLFAYERRQDVTDESGDRGERVSQLWLASPSDVKPNHMLLALEYDLAPQYLSWSSDLLNIVYLNKHRAYLAKLGYRELSGPEKREAGLPLTLDDEKQIIDENVFGITVGIEQCMMDTKNRTGTITMDEFTKFGGINLFQRPSTGEDLLSTNLSPDAAVLAEYLKTTLGDHGISVDTFAGTISQKTGSE